MVIYQFYYIGKRRVWQRVNLNEVIFYIHYNKIASPMNFNHACNMNEWNSWTINMINYTQSQKNRTFLKLPVFWTRLYTTECRVIRFWMQIFLKLFRKPIRRFLMTPDYMTLTLGPREYPWRKVVFLLRLRVPKSLHCENTSHLFFLYFSYLPIVKQ